MEAALTFDDPYIGAYRIHCQAYKRGYSVRQIVSEMLGKGNGATKGKGGSMHYYKKSTNFYGGNGIVGAQIPVGVGLAFALKYQKKPNVASIGFGDGAANQGQLFEAANMAKLWNLPALFIC
jgi:pyruvate dehydrogenase E1 component alpha subunit